MQIHNIEQGTEEWLKIRLGKLTASKAQAIGNIGKGLETLCLEKTTELLTGKIPEFTKTSAMEQGNELESQARFIYELESGNAVLEIGFCEYSEFVGCSPDGFVGDNGLVEIKCPQDNTYTKYLITGEVDTGYMWQMQMQMLITNRKWCDYVVYNPNFEKQIIIKRIFADEKMHQALIKGFELGEKTIKENLDKIK